MSESNIENEEGYQDAGEIGPDTSIYLAWWSWVVILAIVILLSATYAEVLAQ